MKIRTITFNHAHNHGSMLQTYALQEFVKKLGREAGVEVDYKVIDYYTRMQQEFYAVFKKGLSVKSLVKNSIALMHLKHLKRRHKRFEQFLQDNCGLTRRYIDSDELAQDVPEADVYISGSDQLWNVRALDFSPVYYLPFVKHGKRISYAASFGPLKIDWEKYGMSHYSQLLENYDAISTRETGSADNVELLTGVRPDVHVDPTFLLTKEDWKKVQSNANYKEGKYILLYCLEPSKLQLKVAEAISKRIGLPILVLRYNNKNDWFNPFVHRYDAGPCDFLAYIDHAAMVLSSSFHGTAFSLIYRKPFYVFNGMKDNRISSILTKTKLQDRSIETMSDVDKVEIKPLNEELIAQFIKNERQKSANYLNDAIEWAQY